MAGPGIATLAGLALERLGHRFWGVLHGGFPRWFAEKRTVTQDLPRVVPASYPAPSSPDRFSVGIDRVIRAKNEGAPLIVDVRPADYFAGKRSDEARAGHIPGARNRPYPDDLETTGEVSRFKAKADLERAWRSLGADPDKPVIIHCRTGHQASQAYFVLTCLLGFKQVLWYDGGWTEWSTRKDLPVTAASDAEGRVR